MAITINDQNSFGGQMEEEYYAEEHLDTDLAYEEPEVEEVKEEPKPEMVIEVRKDQRVKVSSNINAENKLTKGDTISLPSNLEKETLEVISKLPNINMLDSDESRKWADVLSEGVSLNTFREALVPALEREGGAFTQDLGFNGQNIMSSIPKFKVTENATLKGERAVLRILNHIGAGTTFQVALWHSGIRLTLKPPSDSELVELNRLLIADKVALGRYTYGLIYSNITAYTTDKVVNFILSHVYDMTAKSEGINLNNLKQHISCKDIPSLIWGMINTMYPKGFRYRRSCINDPEKCNNVVEDTLNVLKLEHPDESRLTDWQKTHMSSRQSQTKDLASIKRYKEDLTNSQSQRVLINKGLESELAITLKTPNISEYIEAGDRWISDIVSIVDKTLGSSVTEKEKNSLIETYGQASAMRQYTHWVDKIEYGTNVIEDRDTIETTLDVLSSDDDIRNQFVEAVVKYINDSTICVIGIPVFECPKCKTVQETDLDIPVFKNILPLDCLNLFFHLLGQRIARVIER